MAEDWLTSALYITEMAPARPFQSIAVYAVRLRHYWIAECRQPAVIGIGRAQ